MTATHAHASASTVTASSTSLAKAVPSVVAETMAVVVRASAVTGTSPSLTVSVQWSDDGTNFVAANPADAFPAITAAGGYAQSFTIKGPYYRLNYAVTGTSPNFTLTASAYFV